MTESFAELLKEYDVVRPDKIEQEGVIVDITKQAILLDSGFKSEVVLPFDQLKDINELNIGDTVDYIIKEWDNGYGEIIGSREEIIEEKMWQHFENAMSENKTLTGKGVKSSNGGLVVSIRGFNCFLPRSLLDIKPGINVDEIVGEDVSIKVIKVNRRAENVLVSRKAYIQEVMEIDVPKQDIEVGKNVTGLVKNIVPYGAFIDLGHKDALLHISDISWTKVDSPSEVLTEGENIVCQILEIKEDGKIVLGYKQLQENPWEKCQVGDKMDVVVIKKADFGIMCKTESGLEGVVPNSAAIDMDEVALGETIPVEILQVDVSERKIMFKWIQ